MDPSTYGEADRTVAALRITVANGERAGVTVATVCNYGCHPTSLGHPSSLISPDWYVELFNKFVYCVVVRMRTKVSLSTQSWLRARHFLVSALLLFTNHMSLNCARVVLYSLVGARSLPFAELWLCTQVCSRCSTDQHTAGLGQPVMR